MDSLLERALRKHFRLHECMQAQKRIQLTRTHRRLSVGEVADLWILLVRLLRESPDNAHLKRRGRVSSPLTSNHDSRRLHTRHAQGTPGFLIREWVKV